jgi:1-acyl-sn-glycerol-3-phosphate acyltransferase
MKKSDFLPRLNAFWRVPLIIAVTGLLSSLSVIFSLFDGTGRLQHWCARKWAAFIFFVSRVAVSVKGLENIDPNRGYVFAANHLSMFDHWAFLHYLPMQFSFAAKSSLFKIPFLGWHLKRAGNIPVYFTNPRQTLKSFEMVSEKIKSGISFVIYPEGMRTFDGVPVAFKRGAFLPAKHARAPIVPVTIIGAHLRLKRGSMVIRPGKMFFIIHPPIEYKDYKDLELKELSGKIRRIILDNYRLEP